MNELENVYDVTKKLGKVLDATITSANRELIIKQVNQLIEQRGTHLQKVTPPYTKEEKLVGKKIVELNEHIEKQMNLLFDELKSEMKQIKNQRISNRSYTNPYENVQSLDGMFLDSKQ